MSAVAIPSVVPSSTGNEISPEDLLQMDGLFELAGGRLLEKQMSYSANLTAGNILAALHIYGRRGEVGHVLPEQTFQCFPRNPGDVRRPDVAFILNARIPVPLPMGHVKVVPDLVVEVVSPNDNVYELDDKLADYRSANIPLVWIVNPDVRVVRVYRRNQGIEEFHDEQTLSGGDVLPGFSVRV